MAGYNYTNSEKPEIKTVIDSANELRVEIKKINAAYQALRDLREAQSDATFNTYFEVMPCGKIDLPRGSASLEGTIKHGLIVTCPNVKDEDLPAEAIAARDKAAAIALAAAKEVKPVIGIGTGKTL